MKYVCALLLACVALNGCKPVEYEIQDNQIRVTGVSGDEIQQVINRTFDSYGWMSRSFEHSSNISHTPFSKNTRTKRIVSSTTEEGKRCSVEILETNDDPVLVTIHTDPSSKYTAQSLIQRVIEEVNSNHGTVSTKRPPTVRIQNLARSADGKSFSGTWACEGNWQSNKSLINFQIEQTDKHYDAYSVMGQDIPEIHNEDVSTGQPPLDFTLTRTAGKMTFTGNREMTSNPTDSSSTFGGTLVLQLDSEYTGKIQSCVKDPVTDDQLIRLFFHPLDIDYCRQVNQWMGDKQSLPDLIRLKNHQVEPSYIEKIYAAGYRFEVADLIKAKNYQLSPDFLTEFKTAGYAFNLDELIKIHNYQLDAAAFKTFKDAGYDFSIDEQIKAKNYQIPASFAAELKKMGCNYSLDELIKLRNYQIGSDYIGAFKKLGCDYSIDELIRLKNYQIPPDYIEAFRKTGYALSIDAMIKARNYQLRPDDLKQYADAGYKFSLDEAIKLKNYSIPPDYILGIRQEGYENFTAEEIIRFRQRNLSVEDIRKIRSEKKKP
jgi:hypothetical protein